MNASATADIELAHRQLDRYAEDFGALLLEYQDIKEQFTMALCTSQRAVAIQHSLATLLQGMKDTGVIVTDARGLIEEVSPTAAALFGSEHTLLQGQAFDCLVDPADRQVITNLLQELEQPEVRWGSHPIEFSFKRADGQVIGGRVMCAPDTEQGNCRYWLIDTQTAAQCPVVPHRSLCRDLLRRAMSRAQEDARGLGLLYIDLDRFKKINDSLGHVIGDRLLEAFAQRLSQVVRERDTVAPFGGDEFIVIAPDLVLEEGIRLVADRIIQSLADPFLIDGHALYVGASIGVALCPQHGTEPDALLRHADTAMVAAKTSGGNTFRLFDANLGETQKNRLDIEIGLRRGLAESQFRLMYQPQVRASDGRIIGVEALLRWDVPGQGTIMPDRFIPIAEETGLILPLGEWALKTACAQLAAWQRDGLVLARMAVNITARQLNDPAFVPLVDVILAETGIRPETLELEITESQLMDRLNVGLTNLIHLRKRGVRIAVDDFGTGYSSLGRIRSLPIDCIKVDRSFIVDVDHDTDSYAITNAILCMARALKLSTIAEGIERTDQAQLLAGIQCDEFQGFLFGKPQAPEAIAAQLRQQQEVSSCSCPNC
jgi:diguanylate cyclase (GGDEF)-like protein/PAS domain S-box-containing protein